MFLFNLLSGAAAYAKTKREGDEIFDQLQKNAAHRAYENAKKYDYYYDPILKMVNTDFYGDKSLRHDQITNRYYPKGQYYTNCEGYDANTRRTYYKSAPKE